jgi:hypothetical protein
MCAAGRQSVHRGVLLVQLDGDDAENVSPVRLVLDDLRQLRLCGFPAQEEVERLSG